MKLVLNSYKIETIVAGSGIANIAANDSGPLATSNKSLKATKNPNLLASVF